MQAPGQAQADECVHYYIDNIAASAPAVSSMLGDARVADVARRAVSIHNALVCHVAEQYVQMLVSHQGVRFEFSFIVDMLMQIREALETDGRAKEIWRTQYMLALTDAARVWKKFLPMCIHDQHWTAEAALRDMIHADGYTGIHAYELFKFYQAQHGWQDPAYRNRPSAQRQYRRRRAPAPRPFV